MDNLDKHAEHFSPNKFTSLVQGVARSVPFVRNAVAMFFCWKDSETPAWVKGLIVGALGYFILPLDAIPDVVPIVGWLDDAGVIAAGFLAIKGHINPDHWQRADEFLSTGQVLQGKVLTTMNSIADNNDPNVGQVRSERIR